MSADVTDAVEAALKAGRALAAARLLHAAADAEWEETGNVAPRLWLLAAEAALDLDEAARAASCATRAELAEAMDARAAARFARARALAKAGAHAAAVAQCRLVLDETPDHARAAGLAGTLLLGQGEARAARALVAGAMAAGAADPALATLRRLAEVATA